MSQTMLKLWKLYQNSLIVNPVKTQVISSGILWGIGDVAAQAVTHSTARKTLKTLDDDEMKTDWKRVARASFFGFGIMGPVGHFWYQGLEQLTRVRFQMQPKSVRLVATKLALDACIFGPFYLLSFFSYMGFSAGKSVAQIKEDVKRDVLPALAVGVAVGPILQVVNFRFVPVNYQLLVVNMFALVDSAFMSWIDQQKDAPWKKWFTSLLAGEEKKAVKEA